MAFDKLMADDISEFVPKCGGCVKKDGAEYLQLQNLLVGFRNPSVMDCKIGTR